jgi:putative polyhydroxyalkanoate system protein
MHRAALRRIGRAIMRAPAASYGVATATIGPHHRRDVMAHLSIERAHHLGHAEAKALAERLARDFEQRLGLAWHWDGDVVHFRRAGVSGFMRVGPATIALDLTLGFLLGAMKPAIERQINAELDRVTGSKEA